MKKLKALLVGMSLFFLSASSYGQLWKQYLDSAKIYKDQNERSKALDSYNKAADELRKDSLGTITYSGVIFSMGSLYTNMGQYEKAEPLYLECKAIRAKVLGREHPDYAASCNNLAILYLNMGEYEKAEPLYLEAKAIRAKVLGKEHPDYAASCNNLAVLYDEMGKYEKAEPLYLEALIIRAKVLGREHPDYATTCNNLGILYRLMGLYDKAEPLFLESKAIRAKVLGKDHPDYAGSCNNLAILYMVMGQYEKAESLYLECKDIRAKVVGKEHPDYGSSCNNLALLYMNMGQYEKAEPLFLESIAIKGRVLGKEHPSYASSCNNLGLLYMNMGQYKKAEPFFLETKDIKAKVLGKEHPDYAASCSNLAGLYEKMGQYDKSEQLFLESNSIFAKKLGKEHPDYSSNCNDLAILYKDMGKYQKAEQFFLESMAIDAKVLGKENPNYTQSCNDIGSLYWKTGKINKAYLYYTEGMSFQQIQIQKIFRFTSEAEKLSYINKNADGNHIFFSFLHSVSLSGSLGFSYNVALTSRNLILFSTQQLRKAIYSIPDTVIQNKYNLWNETKTQLAGWYMEPITERAEQVKILEEKANDLEKDLTRSSIAFNTIQQKKVITWQAIQQNLKPNEAAIEFVDFNFYNGKNYTDSTYYIALLLRKDKLQPELIKLFEKKQLDSLLNDANEINGLYTQNASLYKLIWKPIEKYLNGITKVYFAPSGNLFKISFAALPINNEKVLCDKYRLVQLNTTASVNDKKENYITASDKLQLYGGIQYSVDTMALKQVIVAYHTNNEIAVRSLPDDLERGGSVQYLPGTEKEIDEIKNVASKTNTSVTLLSGINATEESFKALNGKASPSVLHIATHGFFFPDPKEDKRDSIQRMFETSGKVVKQSDNPLFRSGLLFAGANSAWQGKPVQGIEDGILTSYEVSNMYLPNTKLVVLSACETALGDIQGSEGVYGLQRAFKIAGVQNLVMSLWKVPDAATAEFMQLFYKNMFARQSISDAFYSAQASMKNKYRNDPYKWAAWVLVR